MNQAVAPYNFVPLPERIIEGETPPERNKYHEDRHTGWIDIDITTLTPIYTRAATELNAAENTPTSKFFTRPDGNFVMPGSGIRGMIRSIFEIITLSDMEFYSKRRLFYRSFADSKETGDIRTLYKNNFNKDRLVGGVLHKKGNEWILEVSTAAEKGFVFVNDTSIPDGKKRRKQDEFRAPIQSSAQSTGILHKTFNIEICNLNDRGDFKGTLIIPGKDVGSNRKYYQLILKPEPNECVEYPVPKDVYEDYLAWGKMAHGSRFGTSKAPRKLENNSPAFALLDENNKVFVIGANMMMPMRYENAISDIVKRSYKGKTAKPDFDMTQSLFGRVTDGKAKSEFPIIRSRVFFDDALCGTNHHNTFFDPNHPVKYPDILSGPKPTSFQMYLKQPFNDEKRHWDNVNTEVRGYKLYWHRDESAVTKSLHSDSTEDKEKVSTKIEPLRSGVVFKGRVRFENLSENELGALYASIRLPEGMAHHFGMGKNLGLGSVRIEIRNVSLLNFKNRLSDLSCDAGIRPSDECEKILETSYHAFVNCLYPEKNTLWRNERMKSLAFMLRCKPVLPSEITSQVSIENTSRQWKDRHVLPTSIELSRMNGWDSWIPKDVFVFPEQEKHASTSNPSINVKPSVPKYNINDKVKVEVVEISPSSLLGKVKLPDGRVLDKINLPAHNVGDTLHMKITKFDGSGKIAGLKI